MRGAFTGADRERVGAFEAADGGTLFLDEIGELPLELQPKLLRVLEEREIRRVGETKPRKVDVRVVAATNRDLEREVNHGRFREDLYFRLAVVTRARARRSASASTTSRSSSRAILEQLGARASAHLFTPQVFAEMRRHDWPGNVRELRNFVERTVVLRDTPRRPERAASPARSAADDPRRSISNAASATAKRTSSPATSAATSRRSSRGPTAT